MPHRYGEDHDGASPPNYLFMRAGRGVDPSLQAAVQAYIQELLGKVYPRAVSRAAKRIGVVKHKELQDNLISAGKKMIKEFEVQLSKYKREHHVNPIIQAVSVLPKDELALMAESLVNLTSFKRRVSLDYETVGGAIDVAIISKGDGFIWIKRKHYFEPKLNPHFFGRYK